MKIFNIVLYAHCMIANDISSDSSAFLNAEKLIACLIFPSITLDHCILSFNSNSFLIWIFKSDEYIAFRNVLHFSLNLIFNSFYKFCIESSFSIKRDLVNLYIWNTSFSSTLFKKLIQNDFWSALLHHDTNFTFALSLLIRHYFCIFFRFAFLTTTSFIFWWVHCFIRVLILRIFAV